MKKILILLLSLTICFSFVCCGTNEDPNQGTPPLNPPSQTGGETGETEEENTGETKEENENQNSGGTPIQPIKPGGDFEDGDY